VAPPQGGAGYQYGLNSVSNFTDEGDHAGLGLTWESDRCADVRATQNACVDPEVAALTADQCGVTMTFEPFTVYYLDGDSMAGISPADHEAQARTRFLSGEEHGYEEAVADILAAAAPAPTVVTTGLAPSEKLLATLATVEQALANLTGSEGVIYMSRFAATMLPGALTGSGSQLRTQLGTRVAALGGGDLGTTMYGTGPVRTHRDSIAADPVAPGMSINSVSVLVQRTYVFGYDCGVVAATTTL
jgi:hypothetical protein